MNEVVVNLMSPEFCGSGGCNTLILKRTPTAYRTVMNARITRPPIRLLPMRTNGWSDIGVMVSGGGIAPYEARLRYDCRRYPSNPSVSPAEPLDRITGTILIDQ